MSEDRPRHSRTVFRPSPLQEMRSPRDTANEPIDYAPHDDLPAWSGIAKSRNPLVEAAQPLLALLAAFRANRVKITLPRLHAVVREKIDQYVNTLRGRCSEETLRSAVFALCVTADDIAQNRPDMPEDAREWARRTLELRYFGHYDGGVGFWVELEKKLLAEPQKNAGLLELYHCCIAAGFEGKYRVESGGRAARQATMQRAYDALTHPRDNSPFELSPHWRGHPTPMPSLRYWTPLALAAAGTMAVLALVYLVLWAWLGASGRPVADAVAKIVPSDNLSLARDAPPPPPPPTTTQYQRICAALSADMSAGNLRVTPEPRVIRITAPAVALFESGSADLSARDVALFQRVAAALAPYHGRITVEGYTDNRPISSGEYSDNQKLSEARARNVAAILADSLGSADRVTARGWGESHAIASNDRPEGQAKNRRVDVTIEREAQ